MYANLNLGNLCVISVLHCDLLGIKCRMDWNGGVLPSGDMHSNLLGDSLFLYHTEILVM